jgi:hypothetical protein
LVGVFFTVAAVTTALACLFPFWCGILFLEATAEAGRVSSLERKVEDLEARIGALERHMASEPERAGSEELETLREELARPVERTAGDIEKALSIFGTGEGSGDLLKNAGALLLERVMNFACKHL